MGSNKLPVVELFSSIQGEGPFQGRRALFLRLGNCNLRCAFCDTKYAITPSKTWRYFEPEELNAILLKEYFGELKHLVITGGEPMLHERLLFNALKSLFIRIKLLEIETNGTIEPQYFHKYSFVVFNVSPKLSNSKVPHEKRIKESSLKLYSNLEQSYFKFVIKDEKDIEEVLKIKEQFFIPSSRIFLMPLASSKRELRKISPMVFKMAQDFKFNYSCRIHIDIFGGRRRGV